MAHRPFLRGVLHGQINQLYQGLLIREARFVLRYYIPVRDVSVSVFQEKKEPNVSGRLKPATRGRIKTGHREEKCYIPSPNGGSGYGEQSQDGYHTRNHRITGTRLVLPPDRPGAGGPPGDGVEVRFYPAEARFKTGHCAPRIRCPYSIVSPVYGIFIAL